MFVMLEVIKNNSSHFLVDSCVKKNKLFLILPVILQSERQIFSLC